MKHVMIDIETLGRNAGCVVLSIAAVEFNPLVPLEQLVKENNTLNRDCVIVDSMSYNISVLSQLLDGAEIETATLDWWRKQGKEAQDALLHWQSGDMKTVLKNLRDFLMRGIDDVKDLTIWSQGTDFDISILRSLYYKYYGSDSEPWSHTNIRDSRTLIFALGAVFGAKDPYTLVPSIPSLTNHNAVDDAIRAACNVTYLSALFEDRMEGVELLP